MSRIEHAPKQTSLEEYLRDPVDRWASGEGWIHFCTREPYTCSTILWGTLSASALEALLACAASAIDRIPEPHAALLDGRRLLSIDSLGYAMCSDFVLRNRKRLAARVTTLAGVRPSGLLGAVAEGFFRVVPAPYPTATFPERGEALRWLGAEVHAPSIDAIERLAESSGTKSVLADLHRAIEQELERADLEGASRTLGMSTRSLQRRLRGEGTTFQREVTVVRVRVAQRLMLDTDRPLAQIAAEAGFSSAAAFSVVFRKLAGQSPSEWREHQRTAQVGAATPSESA